MQIKCTQLIFHTNGIKTLTITKNNIFQIYNVKFIFDNWLLLAAPHRQQKPFLYIQNVHIAIECAFDSNLNIISLCNVIKTSTRLNIRNNNKFSCSCFCRRNHVQHEQSESPTYGTVFVYRVEWSSTHRQQTDHAHRSL